MSSLNPRLLQDIDEAEALRLTAYKDSVGLWTIGWGHLLPRLRDWSGYTITRAQADNLRDQDVFAAWTYAQRLPEWSALDTICRQDAVIELCFNLGGNWLGFHHTRAAIQVQDWLTAHDQLLNSKWASQVHAKRANRIANYLLTGVYPEFGVAPIPIPIPVIVPPTGIVVAVPPLPGPIMPPAPC